MSNRVAAVRAAGARLPLTDEVISQVTRASTPGDDHRARVRTAGTLGLPAPAAPPRQKPATSGVGASARTRCRWAFDMARRTRRNRVNARTVSSHRCSTITSCFSTVACVTEVTRVRVENGGPG
jgi:hypothetical protein